MYVVLCQGSKDIFNSPFVYFVVYNRKIILTLEWVIFLNINDIYHYQGIHSTNI